jgi:hypothetical protein
VEEFGWRRQEQAIGLPECQPLDLPAQHRQLVPDHDDLELFELRRSEQRKVTSRTRWSAT